MSFRGTVVGCAIVYTRNGKIVYPSFCICSVILCLISQDDTSIPCSHLVWFSSLDFSACFISLSNPINWNDQNTEVN